MTTPTHSPAEIRDAAHVLRGLTVTTAGADRFTTAVRVAVDVMEERLDSLEGTP